MLLKQLSGVQRSTFGSIVSGFASQFGLLISGILSSRILGPEDRGYLAILVLVPLLLCHVGSLGLPLAATYFVGKTPQRAGAIARSLAKPALAQMILFGTLQVSIFHQFTEGRAADVQLAAILCALLLPSWLVSEYGHAFLQGQQRFTALSIVRSWGKLFHAGILVTFFILGLGGLPLVAATWPVVACVEATLTLFIVSRRLSWTSPEASDPTVKQMTRFGLKALAGAISPLETLRLDQVMVSLFLTPRAVGMYVTAGTLTNLPRLIAQSIGLVAYPHITAQGEPAAAWRSTWKFFWLTLVISLAAAGCLATSAGVLIPLFFGDAFAEAVPASRVLLLSAALASGRRVLADGARGLGYPGLNTTVEIVSWCLLVVAMIVLVDRWGIVGVATSLAVTSGFSLALLILGLVFIGQRDRQRSPQPAQEDVANAQGY